MTLADATLAFSDEVEPAIQPERERYRTDAGRTVLGGGGITPDVHATAEEGDSAALRLQRALGADVPRFRDAITEFALELKERRAVTTRDFTVTPEMLDRLWTRLQSDGITMLRSRMCASLAVNRTQRSVVNPAIITVRACRYSSSVSSVVEKNPECFGLRTK